MVLSVSINSLYTFLHRSYTLPRQTALVRDFCHHRRRSSYRCGRRTVQLLRCRIRDRRNPNRRRRMPREQRFRCTQSTPSQTWRLRALLGRLLPSTQPLRRIRRPPRMKREIPVVRPARRRSRRRYDFESTCPPKREEPSGLGRRRPRTEGRHGRRLGGVGNQRF